MLCDKTTHRKSLVPWVMKSTSLRRKSCSKAKFCKSLHPIRSNLIPRVQLLTSRKHKEQKNTLTAPKGAASPQVHLGLSIPNKCQEQKIKLIELIKTLGSDNVFALFGSKFK